MSKLPRCMAVHGPIVLDPLKGPSRHVSIVVLDGRIEWVGRGAPPAPSACERIRGESLIVTPGLVSAHTHLGLYPVRGLYGGMRLDEWVEYILKPWESSMEPRDAYSSALLALSELSGSGVTLVADMHFHEDQVARAVERSGLKALLSVAIMDEGTRPYGRRLLEENIRLAEEWHGRAGGRIRASMGPCTLRLARKETIRRAFEEARRRGLRIQMHISEVWEDVEYVYSREKMRPAEYLDKVAGIAGDTILAHGVWISGDEIRLIGERGASMVHCPRSNMLLGSGLAPALGMLSAGVNVALGVDAVPTYDLRDEMQAAIAASMLRGEPLSHAQVYRMATLNGYRALGFEGGVLERGAPGDLVVWRPRVAPLSSPASIIVNGAAEPLEVYVDGEKVYSSQEGPTWITREELEEHEEYLRERLLQIYGDLQARRGGIIPGFPGTGPRAR